MEPQGELIEIHRLSADRRLVRTSIDAGHVDRLAEVSAELPPILVDRASLRVVDGAHRLAAHRLLGRTAVAVRWVEGDEPTLLLMALAANTRHGLPLSREERRRAVERLLTEYPAWSNRKVAEAAAVSEGTVRNVRAGAQLAQPARVVGKDGKCYAARARPTEPVPEADLLRRLLARVRAWLRRLFAAIRSSAAAQ